jgi:hypothetical protein
MVVKVSLLLLDSENGGAPMTSRLYSVSNSIVTSIAFQSARCIMGESAYLLNLSSCTYRRKKSNTYRTVE